MACFLLSWRKACWVERPRSGPIRSQRVGHVITQTGTASDNGIGGETTEERRAQRGDLPAKPANAGPAHQAQKIVSEKKNVTFTRQKVSQVCVRLPRGGCGGAGGFEVNPHRGWFLGDFGDSGGLSFSSMEDTGTFSKPQNGHHRLGIGQLACFTERLS